MSDGEKGKRQPMEITNGCDFSDRLSFEFALKDRALAINRHMVGIFAD
jgi:hypothetical protein